QPQCHAELLPGNTGLKACASSGVLLRCSCSRWRWREYEDGTAAFKPAVAHEPQATGLCFSTLSEKNAMFFQQILDENGASHIFREHCFLCLTPPFPLR